MGKYAAPFLVAAATVALMSTGHAQESPKSPSVRVGTFDSRAVAVVFYQSEQQRQYRRALSQEYSEAEASGDEWRIMQLDALFPALQHRMHQQGFSTASIRGIMQTLSAELPRVAGEEGVSVIVSKWELPYWSEAVELVDLTPQIVALIDPSERALGMVEELKASAPVSMEQLLAHEEGGRSIGEAIRPVIDERGVEAGIEYYQELREAEVERHRKIKESRQEKYDFGESQLNELGYHYLGEGETETAIEIFKLNVEAYPDGFNTYDSLGEAYVEAGQAALAIQNYERSLELNPGNDNARQMLDSMAEDAEANDDGAGD
jgi:tetratricopeptide (TPR) repeat protein